MCNEFEAQACGRFAHPAQNSIPLSLQSHLGIYLQRICQFAFSVHFFTATFLTWRYSPGCLTFRWRFNTPPSKGIGMAADADHPRRRSSIEESEFQCNICLEPVQDPVVTQCVDTMQDTRHPGHFPTPDTDVDTCTGESATQPRCCGFAVHTITIDVRSWSCLYQWLQLGRQTCPVCKAAVTRDNIIPLYTNGKSQASDPHPA